MWTRAAVAPRNINICEMPSHDDYLGAGRGAGCGARVLCGCVPVAVRACWAGAPWGGQRGSCVLQVCVLPRGSWVPGLDNPGRAQWASRVRFGFSPYTWSSTHVALCPACYPGWECRLHVRSMTRSLVDCVRSPELSGLREPRGMGSPLTFPRGSNGMYKARVPQPHSPSYEVQRSSARVSHLGSNSSGRQRAGYAQAEVGGRVVAFKASETHKMKAWDLRTVTPFCLLSCVPGTPGSLQLCFWQPSAAGAVALAAARNLPGHFCARGGLWQAESRAKRARQKGGSGLRAALETSAPPRPRLESQETKSRTRRPIGAGWGGELWRVGGLARGPAPRLGGSGLGSPHVGSCNSE